MSRHASFAMVVAALGLAACGGFGSSESTPPPTETPDGGGSTPDGGLDPVGGEAARGITMTAGKSGETLFVMQGKLATAAVTLVRRSGSVGPVSVTVKNLPAGVTADALTIPMGANDGTLTLHATAATPQGLSTLDVNAVEQVTNGASATAKLDTFVRGLPGTLDTTFATGGVMKNVFAAGTSSAADARVLQNGAIVVSGRATNNYSLVRFTPNGALDTTFGGGSGRANIGTGQGQMTLDVHEGKTPADSYISAVASGTIVPLVLRAKFDGLADVAFGGTGQVTHTTGFGNGNGVQTIALPDGSALVLSIYVGTTKAAVVSRWKPNGTLDTSYGDNGSCVLGGSGTGSEVAGVSRMLPGPNGAVRVALTLASGAGAIKACTAAGMLDSSIGTSPDYFRTVPGSGDVAPYFDGGLVFFRISSWGRVNAAYIIDNALGSFGSVSTTPEIVDGSSIVPLPDGAVLVGGSGTTQGTFTIMRFLQTGARDQSFATAGVATITIATNSATMTRMIAQPDGRLLLLGRQDDNFDGVIARVWP